MSFRTGTPLLVLVAACAPEPPPPATATPEAKQQPAAPSATDAPAATKRCTLAAGESSRTVTVGDTDREFLLAVGTELEDAPAVVFAWHGFGSRPELSREALDPSTHWNDAIVVAPRGLPRTFEQFGDTARPGWQVASGELADRDLALFDAIVEELEGMGCLDRRRVYTTGFSNGGFFSNVLACHRGEVIAAAAPAGGGGPFITPCGPPVPVLITHGRVDEIVPYEAATKTFAHWTAHNGCGADATPPPDGCAAATACPSEAIVRMCSEDLGHRWPQGQGQRTAEFLRRFTRPESPSDSPSG